MEIYLIRHGIAAERGSYPDDTQRPLIEKGRDKTTKVANRLLAMGLEFNLILCSPLVRAEQTAEILKQVGLTTSIITFAPLKPKGDIESWLQWLQPYHREHPKSKIALVGHQPDLSNWAELLVGGSIKNQMTLKKAGIIGIEIPQIGIPIARSTLFLLISPKWLIR